MIPMMRTVPDGRLLMESSFNLLLGLELFGVLEQTEISFTGKKVNLQICIFLPPNVRSGIEKNTGTHWLRVEQPKDSKVVFKQIEVEGDMVVATDKDNNVYYKMGFNKDLKGKNYF